MKAVKDVSLYVITTLMANLLSIFLLLYFSRKLGVSGYGELSYYQTYLTLFVILIGFSQQEAIQRYYFKYGKKNVHSVVAVGYGYTLLMGLAFTGISLLFNSQILVFISLTATFQTLFNTRVTLFQCEKNSRDYTISGISYSVLVVIFTVSLFETINENLILIRFIALFLANFFAFAWVAWFYRYPKMEKKYKLSLRIQRNISLYLMSFSLPILLNNLSNFVRGQIDKIFIFYKFSTYELGIYSMGVNLAVIVSMYIYTVNKAIQPYFFDKLRQQNIAFKQIKLILAGVIAVVLGLELIAMIIPESWFLWVIGEKFLGVKYYFSLFLLDALLIAPYLLLYNILYFHGANKLISTISIASTLIYVVLLFALLQVGVKYLPYASITTSLLKIAILYVFTYKIERKISIAK